MQKSLTTHFEEAMRNKDIPSLKKIAEEESFTIIGLYKDLPEKRLSWLISIHIELFGLNEEKIRKDLPFATKSKNIDDHTDFLLQTMIDQIPDEPKEPLLKWYHGQVLRFAETFINAGQSKQAEPPSSKTEDSAPTGIATIHDFMRFSRERDKALANGVLYEPPEHKPRTFQ